MLYNTNYATIKTAYNEVKTLINQMPVNTTRNFGDFDAETFNYHISGLKRKSNFMQTFSIGSAFGDFDEVGAALGRYSQRLYLKATITKKSSTQAEISFIQIASRFSDEFSFADDSWSQSLGCWSKDYNSAEVSRSSITGSKVCLEDRDFINLRRKARNAGITVGETFFIYSNLKIFSDVTKTISTP